MVVKHLLVIAGALCLSAPVSAQEVIRENVPLVLIPVTVTTPKGELVSGLTEKDFAVYDDGSLQRFQLDTPDTVLAPVSMVIAIQTNNLSELALQKIRDAGSLIEPMLVGDRGRAAVLAYDSELRLRQPMTTDFTRIRGAFTGLQPLHRKQGVLLDAVDAATRMLQSSPPGDRKILLILGESRDRGSVHGLAPMVEAVQRTGIEVYFISYSPFKVAWTSGQKDGAPPPTPGTATNQAQLPGIPNNPNNLNAPNFGYYPNYAGAVVELGRIGTPNAADALASATGGKHLSFTTEGGLQDALIRAGQEIHSQYLIAFAPKESDNIGFHKLQVRVPSRPDLIVRARPGYWPRK
jgi:VWFA-related protein